MPIYEYVCKQCKSRFELLVHGPTKPQCPSCHSKKLQKQISVFAVSNSDSTAPACEMGGPCGRCGHPDGPGTCGMN